MNTQPCRTITTKPCRTICKQRGRQHTSPADIRAWARANGIAVPHRGRLPADVRQAWLAAHPH